MLFAYNMTWLVTFESRQYSILALHILSPQQITPLSNDSCIYDVTVGLLGSISTESNRPPRDKILVLSL